MGNIQKRRGFDLTIDEAIEFLDSITTETDLCLTYDQLFAKYYKAFNGSLDINTIKQIYLRSKR